MDRDTITANKPHLKIMGIVFNIYLHLKGGSTWATYLHIGMLRRFPEHYLTNLNIQIET
jgi:hypothetical protein